MALVIVADDSKCPPNDQGEKCISFGCEVDPKAPITLGEWHLNLPKAKALADEKNIPMIAIWSNTGCSHCQGLLDALLTQKFIDWRIGKFWKNGTYSCPPMILVFMEGGKEGNEWIDENGKLHNQEDGDDYNFVWGPDKKAGLYPFVAFYWKQKGTSKPKTLFTYGDDLTETYSGVRGATKFISRAEVFFEGYQGWDLEKDRALDDFKSLYSIPLNDSQNLKTDELGSLSSISISDEGYGKYLISEPYRKKYPEQDLYLLSNLYSFSAFFYGSIIVEPETLKNDYFKEHLKLIEKNFRPLFVVYGNKHNQRMSNWSYIFSQNTRGNPTIIGAYQTVKGIGSKLTSTSAERDIYKGYYFLYFLDDEVDKPSKFQKVKDFINQYEDITEKYAQPVYMVYCKYPDGHVYARYGSLNSFNRIGFKLASHSEDDYITINGDQDTNPQAKNAIWNLLDELSKEINYRATKKTSITYVSPDSSILEELAPQYAIVQAVERKWIPVKVNLSSWSEVNQHIKNQAYAVSAFIDEAANKVYYPDQKIEVDDDITLKVVFDKALIYTVSFAARSSDETILLQSIVAKSESGSTVASCMLPAASEVTSKCSKPGFIVSAFEDQDTKTRYEFGQSISVSRDTTLCIVWREQQGKGDQKPAKIQTKHVMSLKRGQFPVSYTYTSLGYKFLRISNNISSVNFHGMIENRGLESQVTSAYIQPGIPSIAASCFYNCYNLTAINSDNSVKMIGDYAFYNCSSLKSINFLGTSNKELRVIGDHAFDGCGLESVRINHQGSVSDSSLDSWCFGNCHQLTSVEFTNSTYLGAHMFDGCENLREVKFNNYHSYVGDYAFANCKSLGKIVFPQKMYMLSEHMFDGCINLTAVEFGDSSDLRQIGSHVFANCPKLTSITLPASVNTLEYLDPGWLAGSSIQRVVFKGVDDSQFVDVIEKTVDAKYDGGIMYLNNIDVVDNAVDLGIPVFAYFTNLNLTTGTGCSFCIAAHNKIFNTDTFKNWVASRSYYFMMIPMHGIGYGPLIDRIHKLCNGYDATHFPFGLYYWKNKDTGEIKYHVFDRFNDDPLGNTDAKLIATIDKAFSGWSGITTEVKVIKPSLTTFGQTSPVTFVSSTGNEYLCENNTITKLPTFRVDMRTDSDFKYGIWYYNAKQLKEFADKNHLPVLVEFGAKSCDPCQDFSRNTYRNQTFQEEIKKRKCLLCKIEIKDGDSFAYPTTTQAYFVSHQWGESKTLIPQLIYYWKKSDSDVYKKVWNYNYRSDPANANYQTVLNKLDAMLGNYSGNPKYEAPDVSTSDDKTYRYYALEQQDDSKTSIELGKRVSTASGQVTAAPDGGYAVITISNVDPAKIYAIATCCDSSYAFCAYSSSGQFIQDGYTCSQTIPASADHKLRVYELELQDNVAMLKVTNAHQAASGDYQALPLSWHATSDIDGRYFICDSKTPVQKYTGSITVDLLRPMFGLDEGTGSSYGSIQDGTSSSDGDAGALTSIEVNQEVNLQDNWYQQYGGSGSFADQKGAIFKVFSGIVESVFLFQNDEESFEIEEPSDYKYPCGKWIQILDDTSEAAFNEIVQQCQENSLPLVILESGVAQTDFDKAVKTSSAFQSWMRNRRYVFLDARSDAFSSRATKELRSFEAETKFDGNTTSDTLPKILVYHGCSTCTADGSIEIYCKKKIECSQSDPSYYVNLIDQFSELT